MSIADEAARIADTLENGNRTDAADAIYAHPNPPKLMLLVLADLCAHGHPPQKAVADLLSLTDRKDP